MKNDEQTTQSKSDRSFTQEMQQAFVDWVKKLPFIKQDVQKGPGRDVPEDRSADQIPAPHPTEGALAGRPLDDKGRP
jgi:hypothetical protein